MKWTNNTATTKPEFGELVLFRLSGRQDVPKIGFLDNAESLFDRTGDRIETDFDVWWASADDDTDWWEDQYVIDWTPIVLPLPEKPARPTYRSEGDTK